MPTETNVSYANLASACIREYKDAACAPLPSTASRRKPGTKRVDLQASKRVRLVIDRSLFDDAPPNFNAALQAFRDGKTRVQIERAYGRALCDRDLDLLTHDPHAFLAQLTDGSNK